MEKYLIALLLFAGVAFAEPVQEEPQPPTVFSMYMRIVCYENPDVLFEQLQKNFGEETVLIARETQTGGLITLWINKETGTMSIVTQDPNTSNICVALTGDRTAIKKSFFAPEGITL